MKFFVFSCLLILCSSLMAQNRVDARVTEVGVAGKPGNYRFTVTVKSPDKGCVQYADWWEVISDNGTQLLNRRILMHSHVNEQPFSRSGSGVNIKPTDKVIVRVHMNTTGYSPYAFRGSVVEGFKAVELDRNFAVQLSKVAPLPKSCAY